MEIEHFNLVRYQSRNYSHLKDEEIETQASFRCS